MKQRETKFRAWNKIRKEMYNVHGWHSEFIFKDTLDGVGVEGNPDFIENVILMQFTGLRDKKCIEIYESDVLSFKDVNYKYVVKFEKGSFVLYHLASFDFKEEPLKWGLLSKALAFSSKFEPQVIGNIHENPELLK